MRSNARCVVSHRQWWAIVVLVGWGLGALSACGGKSPVAPDVGMGVAFRSAGEGPTPAQQARLKVAEQQAEQAARLATTGRHADAAAGYEQVLAVQEQILGQWHADVAATLNQLIPLYRRLGRLDEATQLDTRVLAMIERLMAPWRPPEVTQQAQEAARLHAQGKYVEAEQGYRRALETAEKTLGPHHLDVAVLLNNLAALYFAQQKYAQAEAYYRRVLQIREQALGPGHLDVAAALNNLGAIFLALGQYSAAEPLYQRAIDIQQAARGSMHPDVATSLHNLAALYRAQSQYSEAEALYQRARAMRETLLGPTHPEVAVSLHALAGLYTLQSRYSEAEALYQRTLALREKVLGAEHSDVALTLTDLASLYHTQGKYLEAEPLYQRALLMEEKILGPEHPKVAASLASLASLVHARGAYPMAEALYTRAAQTAEKSLGGEHPDVAVHLTNLGTLYHTQRRYQEAEQLYRRALGIVTRTYPETHPRVVASRGALAKLLRARGQGQEELPLYTEAVQALEARLGTMHPEVATALSDLARVHRSNARYAEAVPLYQRALAIREQALGRTHPLVAVSLHDLAGLAQGQSKFAEAERLYKQTLALREQVLGATHPLIATTLSDLATLYQVRGQLQTAEATYRQAIAATEQALGAEHPEVAVPLHALAALLATQGRPAQARPLYERARRIHLSLARLNSDFDDATLRGLLREGNVGLHAYATLLTDLAPKAPEAEATQARREAFVVVEQMRGGTVQAALARAGVHAAADDPAMAQIAGQAQVLREQRQSLRKQLDLEYRKPVAERQAQLLAQLQQDERSVERELTAATERLRTRFPQYAELTSPVPIDLDAVAQLLRSTEALVSFYTLGDRLLVWLVRAGQPWVYHEVAVSRGQLAAQVERVRASLDQTTNTELAAGKLLPFDVAGAHDLYTLLFEPLRAALSGVQHVFVVPDDVLLPVPFSALLTQAQGEDYSAMAQVHAQRRPQPPAALGRYTRLPWLAREYALTVLPSATALRALRQVARPLGGASQPLIAFGDPVLQGEGQQRGGPVLAGRGPTVPMDLLRSMAALPGTREELHILAEELRADPATALHLGERATETVIRDLNSTGRLATARVLAFATHALVKGEVDGLAQPALVLTPPATPTAQDDGLLSLEEILELKLPRVEWVILSACNTGASDGSGEGLSGLTRAFFFAGARSVLVSHWSVDDQATRALMSEVFRLYARDPAVSRAEALRQGMLAVLQRAQGSTAYFAHPFAWAPFFLVGEGTERTATSEERTR